MSLKACECSGPSRIGRPKKRYRRPWTRCGTQSCKTEQEKPCALKVGQEVQDFMPELAGLG
ncbi:MAG: hypothetical protein ACLP9L_13185 [Thermoguttaceae bacterium]